MVAAKTADDLLSDVSALAQLPDADGRLSSADILGMASRKLSTLVAQLLISARQERWVWTHTDIAITSGTAKHRIPSRALAAGLADVVIVDSSGEEWNPPLIEARDRHLYARGRGGTWKAPYGYTWEGDHVVLLPTPTETRYSLRLRYPRQPARLVELSACAEVSSAGATSITTAANVPSAWGSSETLDIVQGTPHGDALGLDLAGTSIATTSITVSAGVPSEVAAGDYVCLAGESCVVPLPESVWPVLVEATTVDVCRRLGDRPDIIAECKEALAVDIQAARDLLEPRSRGERRVLIRRSSPLRRGRHPFSGWS